MSGPGRRRDAEPRTSEHVARELAAAQAVLAAREAAVQAAAAAYEGALDHGREAALEARGRLGEAEVDRDVARRAAAKLEAEHGLALEAERRAALAGVVGAADAAIAAYREACERLLPEMGHLARQLAAAWAAAEEANETAEVAMQAALKLEGVKSASRCRPGVEDFRIWPGRPREVVGEPEEFEAWTNAAGEAPGDAWQERIRTQPDGTGVLHDGGRTVFTFKRLFRRERVIEGERARGMSPLLKELCIPGVTAADQPGWTPLDFPGPRKVRSRLAELEHALDIAEDRRWPDAKVVPVGPPWEVGHTAPPATTPFRGPYGSADAAV